VYQHKPLTTAQRLWARPLYRLMFDPDGRTPLMRLRGHLNYEYRTQL